MKPSHWLAPTMALLLQLPAQAAPLTPEQLSAHLLNRIAFGPAPGDIERVTRMGAQRYIDSQLMPEAIALPAALSERLRGLDAVQQPAGAVLGEYLEVRKEAKDEGEEGKARRRAVVSRIALQTDEARIARAIDSPRQLEEVMVDFWFNHFNVFAGKGLDRALIASYERDAIRPYAFGSFRALLGATAKHPAMLYYLDNWLSTANDYKPRGAAAGPRAKASGLNENYARELMELHTLGVDGGYTQKDVTELARMLTGWTYLPRTLVRDNQSFQFDARRHDDGAKQWLGQPVRARGEAQGEYALDVLAMHPATAHHVSYQLAQYFVRDDPPPALVERMAATWLASRGDIRSVLRTLFASAEFLAPENVGAKFKTPYQFVISTARASAVPLADVKPLLGTLNRLGMPLYGCQTPDGYKNTQQAWLNPDALSRRIAFANGLAGDLDAAALQATLGAAISPRTQATVADSPPRLRAAMLLGSPDFMQR
ncbi:MAG TPA: DUF1800 domain-containing protein [Janthinobacterium sp.]|nr:DUF1800 domain-containing protein [Janthinobacterium sp.]